MAWEPEGTMSGRRLAWYVGAVLLGFALFFLSTRSSVLIGDAAGYLEVAGRGDPADFHYGEPGHFLQLPLARAVWQAVGRFGLPVSLEGVSVAISLAGTLAAIVFFGLIAAEFLGTPAAACVAAVLFGTSLNISTQWNGELYGLPLGFVTAGLFLALRGRLILPAVLWALSVFSHSEFTLAAPAFVGAVWMAQPGVAGAGAKFGRALALLAVAAGSCGVFLIAGSWALGKWTDAPGLAHWLQRSLAARQVYIAGQPEVVRALKGLLTAYTVGGHYWRDVLTGRGSGAPAFLLASSVGVIVIALTAALLAASVLHRRLVLFGLLWLVPFHVMLNWWFVPTVEKYHAGALPGFVLLVTGGLLTIATRLRSRGGAVLCAVYVVACVGLNLLGAVLPMQALGRDVAMAEREIRQLADQRGGRAVFIACDDSKALVRSGVDFLRLRSIWTGTVPEIQGKATSWTEDRLREGKEPYVVGRWCLPEEWNTTWSKQPFDLFFLERWFQLVPTRIIGIPIAESVPTNPFNWTRGDVVRLVPRSGGTD